MKKYSFFLIAILLSGCAQRQLENKAVEIGSDINTDDIRFSYEVKNAYSTEYFGMVGFVLENNTHQWMTVDSIELIVDPVQQMNIAIIGGNDIDIWFSSMSKEKQIESMNRQMLWGTISMIAGVGASLSKDEQVKRAAAFTAISGGTLMTVERVNMMKNQIGLLEYFPEDHLLRTPYRIPPGLGIDKWMVINSQTMLKDVFITTMRLKIYYNGKSEKLYNLEFIKDPTLSPYPANTYSGNWQKKLITKKFKPVK